MPPEGWGPLNKGCERRTRALPDVSGQGTARPSVRCRAAAILAIAPLHPALESSNLPGMPTKAKPQLQSLANIMVEIYHLPRSYERGPIEPASMILTPLPTRLRSASGPDPTGTRKLGQKTPQGKWKKSTCCPPAAPGPRVSRLVVPRFTQEPRQFQSSVSDATSTHVRWIGYISSEATLAVIPADAASLLGTRASSEAGRLVC